MVIPEDPTNDQYILKPVVEQLFAGLGKSPRVQVLANPRLRGISEALSAPILADIVAMYPMVDLFLVLVDRDAEQKRPGQAEERAQEHPDQLFVCLAIEEVEVWMLALHRDLLETSWQEFVPSAIRRRGLRNRSSQRMRPGSAPAVGAYGPCVSWVRGGREC
jgi:hypothetical protein